MVFYLLSFLRTEIDQTETAFWHRSDFNMGKGILKPDKFMGHRRLIVRLVETDVESFSLQSSSEGIVEHLVGQSLVDIYSYHGSCCWRILRYRVKYCRAITS